MPQDNKQRKGGGGGEGGGDKRRRRPDGRGPGGRGGPQEEKPFEEVIVRINRCAKVMKGGRRFSWTALVVVGDRKGQVGFGYGKAGEVPPAVEKGIKGARKSMVSIPLKGKTLPHEVIGKYGATEVFMKPAAPGTGVIAGAAVRAVMVAGGVSDVLTKVHGNSNAFNVVRATFDGIAHMRRREDVERLRGVLLEEAV